MAEPEHSSMHNFAYHPSVASWVQSTALAHYDGASDEVPEHSPDDFYKSALPPPADYQQPPHPPDMTTTRQRQQTPNGAARSTPKPSVRSASGPATSTTSTPRSGGTNVPVNRPTVRSLAQKFNQPSSTESSPTNSRARPVRPLQNSASSSPARPAKEASYGTYKFNNLKPRERPQPAPQSPSGVRRPNGGRASLGPQPSPSRKKVPSPPRGAGRKPFFGEVVGEHDASVPGFGIPLLEGGSQDTNLLSPLAENSTIKIVTKDPASQPEGSQPGPVSPGHRRQVGSISSQTAGTGHTAQLSPSSDNRTPRRRSPPSRIPVATQRMSTASDSGSSTRSFKYNGARPVGSYRTSPTRQARKPIGRGSTSPMKSAASAQATLPAVSYRGYRERGKSPQGAKSGPSVAAVITAPPPPTSPRLRNSRERQTLQESPRDRSGSADPHAAHDYFGNGLASTGQQPPLMTDVENTGGQLSVKHVESTVDNDGADIPPLQPDIAVNGQDPSASPFQLPPLSLSTDGLQTHAKPISTPNSFEYEESPVLGMPGSFMMTPPLVQRTPPMASNPLDSQQTQAPPASTPEGELLQARTFQPANKGREPEASAPTEAPEAVSEFGVRESIPIMLGSDDPHAAWNAAATRSRHSPRLSIGEKRYFAQPLDSTGTISYLEEDDSPIDPFSHRETLRPDDSASVAAFYRHHGQQAAEDIPQIPSIPDSGSLTLDSEAYSVINKVLNMYHQSDTVTADMAHNYRDQVQDVSPIVAQHTDWGSKEATETYLARLLSDAAGNEPRNHDEPDEPTESRHSPVNKYSVPALSIRELEADPEEPVAGGTAIIFPPESRRYSRGSRGSAGSAATTIWEGVSRPDSSSGVSTRDRTHGNGSVPSGHSTTYAIHRDWTLPTSQAASMQLPEIAGAGEGLGLSLQNNNYQQQPLDSAQYAPPRPPYSPPPPPGIGPLANRIHNRDADGYATSNTDTDVNSFHARPSVDQQSLQSQDTLAVSDQGGVNKLDTTSSSIAQLGAELESAAKPISIVVSAEEQNNVEITQVTGQQPELDEVTRKVRDRYRVVEELTKTEHSFCVDMMVAHQIFEGTSHRVLNEQERKLLFCNCKDIEAFAHRLWKDLKEAIRPVVNQTPPSEHADPPYDEFVNCTPDNDYKVNVGAILMNATPRMERVYTTYFLNFTDASDFIAKNAQNPELLGWVMACFEHCPNLTTAWDLGSLLTKPTQRIAKYPLLLDSLIAKTPPDHPDLPDLKAASEAIKNIMSRIQEAKNRQATLRAATSEGKKQKNKGRFGKTIVKALTSNKDRAKSLQEATQIFEDQDYNQVTQKFGGHFFQIQIVIRDLDQYLDAITEQMLQLNSVMLGFITVSETGPSANAEMESTWRRWAMAYIDLQNKALDEHKTAVRNRVMKPISEVWNQWVGPQKLMEQRKKALLNYAKFKQATERKEKIDSKLEDGAKDFMTINDSLKQELPRLYELTKKCIRICEIIFIGIQKDWYKTCSKKILPLLESEPQHTTSITYDFKVYVDRFKSDYRQVEERAKSLAIVNHELMNNIANFTSPNPTFYSDDASSRKSSSRRTESIGSDMSMIDHHRNRNSGGYNSGHPTSRSGIRSFEGPPRSSPAAPYAGPSYAGPSAYATPSNPGSSHRNDRAFSPISQTSDGTITQSRMSPRGPAPWSNMDGAFDDNTYAIPPQLGASFLNPTQVTPSTSNPSSSRTSGVFNSALPMSDSIAAPPRPSAEELPATPTDMDEPEVLFLAASLFEFNIAHDRREGGIPYLVYVPGEIFDVIGMKGELWLARNQDDPSKTVGWIWEKHFARILPEDA